MAAKLSAPELYRRLRALGFSAEQALVEMEGMGNEPVQTVSTAARSVRRHNDETELATEDEIQTARRLVSVSVPRRVVNRGPRMEYIAAPVRKGQKITVAMGNNTDVYKVLSKGKALTVPQIAKLTGISPHSVESSVYQLTSTGLVQKRLIAQAR
jgi:hypothetical protein